MKNLGGGQAQAEAGAGAQADAVAVALIEDLRVLLNEWSDEDEGADVVLGWLVVDLFSRSLGALDNLLSKWCTC